MIQEKEASAVIQEQKDSSAPHASPASDADSGKGGNSASRGSRSYPLWLALLIIPWLLTIWLRLLPASFPYARQMATDSVYEIHREKVGQSLGEEAGTADRKRLRTLLDTRFEQYKGEHREQLDREIEEKAGSIRKGLSYQHGGRRFPYLGDYDPYLYLRYARNILAHGLQGDCLKEGKGQWDNHVMAPYGVAVRPLLHPMFIAFFYRILSSFDQAYTIMESSFYVPLAISLIAALLVFLAGRRLGGNLAGLLASVFFSVNPALIGRSLGSDTDIYNVALPAAVVFFLLEALRADRAAGKLIMSALSGLFLGLFVFAWVGWWFLPYSLAGSIVLAVPVLLFTAWLNGKPLAESLRQSGGPKDLILICSVLFSSAILSAILFTGKASIFFDAWRMTFQMAGMKDTLQHDLWPNVFLSVAELQPASWPTLMSITGGEIFLLLCGAGLVIIAAGRKENRLVRTVIPILFAIWIGGTIYTSLKGARFLLLLVPPFAITAGVALAALSSRLFSALRDFTLLNRALQAVAVLFVTGLMCFQISLGYKEAVNFIPAMNSAYDEAFTFLREKSSPDAIVTSYWDYGDFITFGSDRAVSVDNHTLEKPPTYWISRILTSRSEEEALAVLRMLNCGSNGAFEALNGSVRDTERSISLLNKALTMKKDEADSFLTAETGEGTAEKLIPLMFGETREQYLLITGDLVGKAQYWGHYGLWDFKKAGIALSLDSRASSDVLRSFREELSLSPPESLQLYFRLKAGNDFDRETWISPRPSFQGIPIPCEAKNGSLLCHTVVNGRQCELLIDRKSCNAAVRDSEGACPPCSLVLMSPEGRLMEKSYGNQRFPYSLIVTEEGGWHVVVSSPELSCSMFTRLFFFKGKGLKRFTRVHAGKSYNGMEIDLWKVRLSPTS